MKYAAAIALAFLVGAAQAETVKQICARASEFAESVMFARYQGVPTREMMAYAVTDVQKEIVSGAYELPDYVTERYRKRAEREYGNEIYMQCHRDLAD